ncbi:MAG: hypothetical protein J4G04_03135 [Nitrosopumilaceae archaeon]|nr:hypothetical protein [Nitrosopumilaceae archaeon]
MRVHLAVAVLVALAAVPLVAADADPATLHKIAKQAQIQAQIQADPADPPRVHELLALGEIRVEAILNSTDAEAAGANFLAAMSIFSEAFQLMNENGQESEDDHLYYEAVLERQARYYGQLLDLAETYGVEASGEELDGLFAQATTQIEAGDSGVVDTLERINHMMGLLREQIGAVAVQEDAERALEYAALYVKHLERLVDDAEELNILPEGVEIMLAIRDRLAAATEPSEIISIINEIIMLKQDLDLVNANQLELWMRHTQTTAAQMLQQGVLDDIEYAAVEATLDRFLEEMEAGDLDEARTLLNRLNAWLSEQ